MQPDLRRTRQALTRRYGVLIVLVLGGFALGVYAQVSRSQAAQARLQVEQLAQAAAAELPLLHHEHDEMERTDLPAWLREQAHAALVARPGVEDQHLRIRWLDGELVELKALGAFRPSEPTVPEPAARHSRRWIPLNNGLALWLPVWQRPSAPAPPALEGYVSVALASSSAEAELARLRGGLVIGAGVAGLVGIAASQWMVAASLDPIRRQLERLIRFTADASHELRHPLTAIRALIGTLRHGDLLCTAPAQLVHRLRQIDESTERMGRLVDDLLLLTRSDRALDDAGKRVSFPLEELVDDLIDLHRAEAAALGVELGARIEAGATVSGHPDNVRRLLENLLSNALRFAPAGSRVTLGLGRQHDLAQLWIDDQGPGIPPELRQLVFDRFWQADGARSSPDHHGLGLAIAQAIAQAHHGRLQALEAPGGGCRMLLELPLAS